MSNLLQSPRNSKRLSTTSGKTTSLAASDSTGSLPSGDPRIEYFGNLHKAFFERLKNQPLTEQRFVPSAEKSDNLNKLALGAKVERALDRRMTGQDAEMRRPLSEKPKGRTSA